MNSSNLVYDILNLLNRPNIHVCVCMKDIQVQACLNRCAHNQL